VSDNVAIAFFDVEGYTEFTATHGDEAGLALADSLLDIAEELVEGARGTVVKRLGDGLMASFATPQEAIRCATGTQRALQVRAELQEEAPVAAAKIAIHWGEAVQREGDLYGNTVNLTARLLDKARGGQTLITDDCREALGDDADALDLKRVGRLAGKGLKDRPSVFLVRGDGVVGGIRHLAIPEDDLLAVLLLDIPGDDMEAFLAATRAAEAGLNGVGARIIFSGISAGPDDDAPAMCVLAVFPDDEALEHLAASPAMERFELLSPGTLELRLLGAYRPMHTFGVLFPEGTGSYD
jgi:class 3 adenylate cyclase